MTESNTETTTDDAEGIDKLNDWWDSEPEITLSRDQWSTILETLAERADSDALGDHIDRMAGRRRRRIMEDIQDQADIDPSIDLTREAYHDNLDDQGEE